MNSNRDTCYEGRIHDGNGYDRGPCGMCGGKGCPPEPRKLSELERLRRIEAAARAWLRAEDRFQAEIYDTQGRLPVWPEVIAAREALRKAIGESDELRKAPQL